jgi:quinol monooxygenase YgiN
MIYGIVSVRVKPGKVQEFIDLFKSVAATVRKEKGCVQYVPAVDFETGLPPQTLDKNVVTILEKWETLEALQAHLAMPYMADFFAKQEPLVEETVSMKMLKEA